MALFTMLLKIVTSIVRIIIFICLFMRILNATKTNKKIIIYGLTFTSSFTILCHVASLPFIFQIIMEIVVITLCVSRYTSYDVRMILFTSITYEIGVSIYEYIISASMAIIFHSKTFLNYYGMCYQISNCIVCLLLFCFTIYAYKCTKLNAQRIYRIVGFVAYIGLFSIITLSQQKNLILSNDNNITWIILSIVFISSIMIFNMRRKYDAEKELAKLKSQQAELLERDYTVLNNVYSANAKLFHDFHNHIGSLRQLILHEKYDEALKYIDDLTEPITNIIDKVWTGDETVDYLINSKLSESVSYNINFNVDVEYPRHTNIKSADLCAILGNLIDNALEAVKNNSLQEEKYIKLKIRPVNQIIVIKVENYFNGNIINEQGEIKTTKTEKSLHGWGLKSAKTAAQKYDGVVITNYESNIFKVVATLNFQSVSIK